MSIYDEKEKIEEMISSFELQFLKLNQALQRFYILASVGDFPENEDFLKEKEIEDAKERYEEIGLQLQISFSNSLEELYEVLESVSPEKKERDLGAGFTIDKDSKEFTPFEPEKIKTDTNDKSSEEMLGDIVKELEPEEEPKLPTQRVTQRVPIGNGETKPSFSKQERTKIRNVANMLKDFFDKQSKKTDASKIEK